MQPDKNSKGDVTTARRPSNTPSETLNFNECI
jgi:hypothetical protein